VSHSCHSSRHCWTVELIMKLWNVTWDMWAHCNGILPSLATARVEIIKLMVNQQIQAIYAARLQALPCNSFHFLRAPLEVTLQLLLTTKQQWVESIEVATRKKKKHEYGAHLFEQHFMEEWVIWQ